MINDQTSQTEALVSSMQQQVTDMMASEEAKDVQISNLSKELVDMQTTVTLCQFENVETEARLGESNAQISQL